MKGSILLNNIKDTEDVLKYQLFTQLVKSAAGGEDSQKFSGVMESVMNTLSKDNNNDRISSGLDEINQDFERLQYRQDST